MGNDRSVASIVSMGLTVLGLLCTPALAAAAGPPPMSAPPITRTRLGNGLDVILQEMHRQPEVAVLVAYEAGSRDDPSDRGQLAHLVEHLTYAAGSRHIAPYKSMSLLQSLGAHDQQGTTSLDTTVYQAVVPSTALAHALWVESERMAFTLERFNENCMALERNIVEAELRAMIGSGTIFSELMIRGIFGAEHPYSRISWPLPNVASLQLSDAQWFYQTHYRPDRAHLILVGDFSSSAALTLVEKYFGPIRAPAAAARPGVQPVTTFEAHEMVLALVGVPTERFTIVYPAPAPLSREDAVLSVFAEVLRSRLKRRLERSSTLASKVDVSRASLDGGAFFEIDVEIAVNNRFAEVEAAVKEEIGKTWSSDWKALLPSAKRAAQLDMMSWFERPLELAEAQLTSLRFQGRPFEPARHLAEVDTIGARDIEALRRYFLNERLGARLVRARASEMGQNAQVSFR